MRERKVGREREREREREEKRREERQRERECLCINLIVSLSRVPPETEVQLVHLELTELLESEEIQVSVVERERRDSRCAK